MNRVSVRVLAALTVALTLGVGVASPPAAAGVGPEAAQKLYDKVSPSLVAVQYTWQNEFSLIELVGPGIVVGEDGLVMAPITIFGPPPDEQMKDFKILYPQGEDDPEEVDAVFLGRDERSNLAFLKPKSPKKWPALKFEDVPVKIGEPVLSIGLLPKAANYKPYFVEGSVSAELRGETPQVLVAAGLAPYGSPVFNADGKAIGLVPFQQGQPPRLNGDARTAMLAINNPAKTYTPARDFLFSLKDLPVEGKPMALPWMGVVQMSGLNKDLTEAYGLEHQPAVQIGDVIPNSPASKAGLEEGAIIVKLDGEPLERGDEPMELPGILRRTILRKKPGDTITLTVLPRKGEKLKDVKLELEEQPKRANLAKRYFAEDLGFVVREVVFSDTYERQLPANAKGVIVAGIKPQSVAQSGGLQNEDMIIQLNGDPVDGLADFKKSYQSARKAKPKEALVLVVRRDGREDTVRIEPPQ